MLIFKPLIIWARMPSSVHAHEKHDVEDSLNEHLEDEDHPPVKQVEKAKGGHGGHDEDISEIAVHQIIETIEFVLGSISNTASYLRLWALSLAHGQLSRVFLEKTIGDGIASANTISIAIGIYFFLNISLGVIMAMDTMECFLHALRLQWVEFDSKFFKADGRKFNPLALEAPLQANAYKLRVEE
jgi:V-type H+-transporting ATPase subunit a